MSPEIERLLGGYATNSLTATERKLLFEAAVNDQSLFDALQDEQALRELLEDRESRRAITEALQPQPRVRRFHLGWRWTWAAGLAAACLLAVLLIRRTQPPPAQVAEVRQDVIASIQPEAAKPKQANTQVVTAEPPQLDALKALAREQRAAGSSTRFARQERESAAPPPAPPASTVAAQAEQVSQAQNQVAPQPAALPTEDAASPGFAGGAVHVGTGAAPFQFVILRKGADGTYAELKPGEIVAAGDWIQFAVRPPRAGTLLLSRQTGAGDWQRLPADAPIQVNEEQRFRLGLMAPVADRANGMSSMLITVAPGKSPVQDPAQ